MKIFSVDKIREADTSTINNEPISSIDLMERASTQLFNWIKEHVTTEKKINIFCGLGNNGGDGLALGKMLANSNYQVIINIIRYSEKTSDDFQINYNRLTGISGITIVDIKETNELQNKISYRLQIIDSDIAKNFDKSAETIEKNKNNSLKNIKIQIQEITKLTLTKLTSINISDKEIKNTIQTIKIE